MIFDFSKIEVGQIKLESISFNLNDLVSDVSKLFVYRAEEKGLDLNMNVASSLAQRYVGDPTCICQILINLLVERDQVHQHRRGRLRVDESVNEDGAPCCLFSVKDTGIGIPESKTQTISRVLLRPIPLRRAEFGGTGLGLAISKKLVELMEGKSGSRALQVRVRPFSSSCPWFLISRFRVEEVR